MKGIPAWLVALSVGVNYLTCGPKGWSLCARFYMWKRKGCLVGSALVYIADHIFWWDKNHCRKAYNLRKRSDRHG